MKISTDLSLVSPNELSRHAQDVLDSIALRAYELFEKRGGTHGNDWGDWFQAESEILKPVKVHVLESNDHLTARPEVPGFRPHEIKVSIEPRRVRIGGRTEIPENRNTGVAIIHSLGHSLLPAEQIFHVAELSAEVDPSKASVTFKDGTLEIVMPKVAWDKRARVQAKVA